MSNLAPQINRVNRVSVAVGMLYLIIVYSTSYSTNLVALASLLFSSVPMEDPTLREMAEYMEANRFVVCSFWF